MFFQIPYAIIYTRGDRMGFAEELYKLRKEAGLSQKELAEKIGVAQASINYWEKNQRTPSISMVTLVADYFNVSLESLLTRNEHTELKKCEQQQREKAARETPQKKLQFFTHSKKGKVIEDGKPPKFTAPSTTYAPQEAYELLHSLIDKEGIDDREREEVSQQLKKILNSFKGLNEIGRRKAVERIEELYMIPKYIFDNFPDNID